MPRPQLRSLWTEAWKPRRQHLPTAWDPRTDFIVAMPLRQGVWGLAGEGWLAYAHTPPFWRAFLRASPRSHRHWTSLKDSDGGSAQCTICPDTVGHSKVHTLSVEIHRPEPQHFPYTIWHSIKYHQACQKPRPNDGKPRIKADGWQWLTGKLDIIMRHGL